MPIKLAPAPKNSGAKAAQDSQDDKSLSGTLSLQSRKEVASLFGMTFQQAQEAVISEMMTLEDTEYMNMASSDGRPLLTRSACVEGNSLSSRSSIFRRGG